MTARRRVPWLLPTVLVVLLVAAAGAGLVLLRYPALVPPPVGGPRVDAVPVARADVTATVRAPGRVASASDTGVSFATDGTVATVDVAPGATVRAGDVLATLDDSSARPRVEAARAALEADGRALAAAGAAVPPDPVVLGRLEAAVASDRAVLADAQREMDATTLRAPGDGTVTAVSGAPGDPVSSGTRTPFVRLADLATLVVRVAVPPRDVPRIAPGQPATAAVDGAGPPLAGEVTGVDPAPTPGGDYGVTVTTTTVPPDLRLGQPADVAVTVARSIGVLVVPPAAVRPTGPDRADVLVRRPDGDHAVTVATGLADATAVEIRDGLTVGDLVVVRADRAS